LDHIEFTVSEVEKSLAFYTRVFGNVVMKNNQTTRRYLKLGANYLAIDKAATARVDHFCGGIDRFDIGELHKHLEGQGIAYRDYPSGKDLSVADPDSIKMQLAASNGWDQLAIGTASPEAVQLSGEPIFRPLRLDRVLLNASDLDESRAFYAKFVSLPTLTFNGGSSLVLTQRTALAAGDEGQFGVKLSEGLPLPPFLQFKVGKSFLAVRNTPKGEMPGVKLFAVATQAFDPLIAAARLEQEGAVMEASEDPSAMQFRDTDELVVQVIAA
ncbi:MAG: hypothetical protein ABI824_11725, partial [Acidobacteriota bacterium]